MCFTVDAFPPILWHKIVFRVFRIRVCPSDRDTTNDAYLFLKHIRNFRIARRELYQLYQNFKKRECFHEDLFLWFRNVSQG